MNSPEKPSNRLDGLDLARFAAFAGMVIVNFKTVMGAEGVSGSWLNLLVTGLEGRAAALFVVLAGIGLGLGAIRAGRIQTTNVILKRSLFLLVAGLINSLIFSADILHYYAFYFLIGVLCLGMPNRVLVTLIAVVNIIFIFLLLIFDYDTGWNWQELSYSGFWTLDGFVRNLFFNGWHPVFPWVSFLLFGIILSRLPLGENRVQHRLMLFGFLGYAIVELVSALAVTQYVHLDPELALVLGTGPIPPMPQYVFAGTCAAALATGFFLRSAAWFGKIGVLSLIGPAGRQTLTLYIAHILIGMGVLEAFGLLGSQSLGNSVIASFAFCAVAAVYALVWSRYFRHGPVESLMRRLAG